MASHWVGGRTQDVAVQVPRQGCRTRLSAGVLLWLFLVGGLVAAGCSRTQAPSPDAGPQLLNTLPSDWTPLILEQGGMLREPELWLPINVDDDAEVEYLLFFTYDSGQIGALIYDQQTGENQVTSRVPLMAPNQPAGTFIPYRLEPNYWPGAGSVGYIAPPGTAPETLQVVEVQRATTIPTPTPTTNAAPNTSGNNELIIWGGNKVFTAAWWKGSYEGYGVVQVAAAGGLVLPTQENNDPGAPVASVVGLEPIRTALARSVLCRGTRYDRAVVEAAHATTIEYRPVDLGITFCRMPPPPYPFYPEGVVLGFLQPENRDDPSAPVEGYRNQFFAADLTGEQKQQFVEMIQIVGPDGTLLTSPAVMELVTPPTVPLPAEGTAAVPGSVVANVCAHIFHPDEPVSRKLLLFQLRHIPPTYSAPGGTPVATTDRMAIFNIIDVSSLPDCAAVMSLSLPGGDG